MDSFWNTNTTKDSNTATVNYYECDTCGKIFKSILNLRVVDDKRFCSWSCKEKYLQKERE
jgi:DNA-directed RNA polymerase subunit RPC12/RpoP